jgi:DNA-binding PucR family transcriptional regulator
MHVAVGSPGHGVEGFRRSHAEALLVSRVAGLAGSRGVTHFCDVSLDVLMTSDLDEARRFVAVELGPLAASDDATRRLSSTLRVFLEEGSSFVRAARRLGVHENTVAYRVHRAEDLLGRRVAERQLELRAALRLARLV